MTQHYYNSSNKESPSSSKEIYFLQSTHAAEALRNKTDQTHPSTQDSHFMAGCIHPPRNHCLALQKAFTDMGLLCCVAVAGHRACCPTDSTRAAPVLTVRCSHYLATARGFHLNHNTVEFFVLGQHQAHFAFASCSQVSASPCSFCAEASGFKHLNNLGKTAADCQCLWSVCTTSGVLLMQLNTRQRNFAVSQSENLYKGP